MACLADGLPKPRIEWRMEGASEVFSGPELHFNSLKQDDAGFYECRATNGVDRDLVARMELKVLGKYEKTFSKRKDLERR